MLEHCKDGSGDSGAEVEGKSEKLTTIGIFVGLGLMHFCNMGYPDGAEKFARKGSRPKTNGH